MIYQFLNAESYSTWAVQEAHGYNTSKYTSGLAVSRVIGTLGVPAGSAIDLIRELIAAFVSAAHVLNPSFGQGLQKKSVRLHLLRTVQHLAGGSAALFLGAIAPSELLIPLMRTIGLTVTAPDAKFRLRAALCAAGIAGLAFNIYRFGVSVLTQQAVAMASVSPVAFSSAIAAGLVFAVIVGVRHLSDAPDPIPPEPTDHRDKHLNPPKEDGYTTTGTLPQNKEPGELVQPVSEELGTLNEPVQPEVCPQPQPEGESAPLADSHISLDDWSADLPDANANWDIETVKPAVEKATTATSEASPSVPTAPLNVIRSLAVSSELKKGLVVAGVGEMNAAETAAWLAGFSFHKTANKEKKVLFHQGLVHLVRANECWQFYWTWDWKRNTRQFTLQLAGKATEIDREEHAPFLLGHLREPIANGPEYSFR